MNVKRTDGEGFYSYLWLRRKDLTPYYAGKGKGRRGFHSHSHTVKCPTEKWRILVFPHATEADAFEHERFLVAIFGRRDNGTGILRNLSDGGDKPPLPQKGHGLGCKRGPFTPEHSRRLSESLRGNKNNLGKKASLDKCVKIAAANRKRGPRSAETKQKIRLAKLGTKLSMETRHRMSLAHNGRFRGQKICE